MTSAHLMVPPQPVGYVLKRYPRYSETFIVNEILAHEAAGCPIEIFALHPCNDSHYQDGISRVRAPVNHLWAESLKAQEFWETLRRACVDVPGLWDRLESVNGEDAREVYQAVMVAQAAVRMGIPHLHAHFATSATTVARLAARLAGITYSFTAHAKDIFHQNVSSDDLQGKIAEAKAVVTVSEFNRKYLCETHGTSADRVLRVYNGMDLARLQYAAPDHRESIIVAVGRIIEKKGFGDLVDACAELVQRGCRFQCQIIGTGVLESQLREQIINRGLQSRVEMLGARPQSEVMQCIQRAAVMAAPCVVGSDGDRDGLPTVLLEAMALGTPCVSTDVTGIPEVIRDGDTGLTVPQRNPRALAVALERLMADSALRIQLAGRARRLIEMEFDVHRNAATIREIFRGSVPRSAGVVA